MYMKGVFISLRTELCLSFWCLLLRLSTSLTILYFPPYFVTCTSCVISYLPCPSVAFMISDSNCVVLELNICSFISSGYLDNRNIFLFSLPTVTKTLQWQLSATEMAACPSEPLPECIRILSFSEIPPRITKPYKAVQQAAGTVAASAKVQSFGTSYTQSLSQLMDVANPCGEAKLRLGHY